MYCSGFGQYDTHTGTLNSYSQMDWGAVLREASNPRSVDKDKGRWIIPSQYTGPEARQAAMQRKHGLFGMLWADIDSGNHSLETVYWAVKKLLGDAEFIIHSSHSHNGLDKLKWHVLTRTMHLIPGFAYTAAATVFIDRLRQLGLTVGNESRDISRLCYLPNPSIPSAYMWFHQPGEPFMWDEDFHNAAALIMAEERRTGEDSDNTGGAGLFEEKYPSAWMLEYLGMHRNGNHFHHPSQTNPTYATIAWPNRGWSTLSDTVAGIFGRKWGDSFDLFSSQIAPNAEYAKAARIALPYGWQIGQDPYEVLNFHKQQGEWLTYYGWCGPTPLGAGAQQLFLERSQERLAQIIEEPISVADGEWEIDWPPGIIGEVAQHIYSNSVKPVKQYSITMAFYLMAGLAGRRYTVYNMGLNLYIIMAGATGTGKGAARSVMRGLVAKIAAADQSPAINNVFAYEFPVSGPAIRKALGRGSPIIACFQEDADDVLTSLASSLGMGPGIKSALLSIWDQAGEEGVLGRIEHSKADDSSVAVQRPSFTFALDTQLAPYKRFMGSDVAQTTGFGSRIILIEYDGEIKPTNHNPRRDLSPNAMERLTSIWQSAYRSPNEFIAVQWSQEAHLLYLDSEEVNRKRMNANAGVAGLISKTPMNVNKFAALLAVAENPHAPIITAEQWSWANAWMTKSTSRVIRMVEGGETGSGETIREFTVVKAIKDYVTISRKTKRDTYKVPLAVIDNPEIIPDKYLKIKLKGISCFKGTDTGKTTSKIIDETIAQLISDEVLATVGRDAMINKFGMLATQNTLTKFYTYGTAWD